MINAGSNGGSDDGIFWNAATGAIVIGDNNTVLGNYIAYTSISFCTGSTQLLGGGGTASWRSMHLSHSRAPARLSALGGAGGGDSTGGLTLNGGSVVPSAGGAVRSPGFPSAHRRGPQHRAPRGSPLLSGYSVTAPRAGSPTSFTATRLPPGLTLNSSTRVPSPARPRPWAPLSGRSRPRTAPARIHLNLDDHHRGGAH